MLLVVLAWQLAGLFQVNGALLNHTAHSVKAQESPPAGCVHEGRWHAAGAAVRTREPCLRCACARGALSCRRRACAALPDPPPRRCHVLHRKGSCCPELHCPDGVKLMELGASTRFEGEDYSDISSSTSVGHACVEGGTVFGAGSALAARVACEQCFCLGGARRCVRPRCLPPPPGCAARPAPGACCPQRYYCEHAAPPPHGSHDCEVEGSWFAEGERVAAAERRGGCAHCFCLRGRVRCQALACAPPLLGCTPLLRPGECCPHQYNCEHAGKLQEPLNSLISVRSDDRSLHTSNKQETSTKSVSSNSPPRTHASLTTATKKMPVTTTKVKRKINETPPSSISQKSVQNTTPTSAKPPSTHSLISTTEKVVRSNFDTSTTEELPETTSTEQPEGSVRIMINGTINCTAELSSTSLPLNLTTNDTERIKMEVQSRVPIINTANIESHTFNPNDIITDRSVIGDFDENEMFIVNVTSSLSTNSSRVAPGSIASKTAVPADLSAVLNMSKKTNEFDFDYAEPTLPPSLPNLKIIPFVAADAVLDDDEPPKEVLTYPILEKEDKYPVYFPTLEAKVTPLASRRKDVYHPTQYPIFTSEKTDTSQYSVLSHDVDITSSDFPAFNDGPLREHTVATAAEAQEVEDTAVTNTPSSSTTYRLETPSVNLFSPPAETEGGFIPKGPGIIGEYYAVYPSTPPGPAVPHLTTSMQLDTVKECISSDGRHVREGESVSLACSVCACAWGEMHCAPRACPAPAGCRRRPAAARAGAACCGDLVCDPVTEKEITSTSTTTTETSLVTNKTNNDTKANEPDGKIETNNLFTNETNVTDNISKIDGNSTGEYVTKTTIFNNVSHSEDIVTTSPTTVPSSSSTSSIVTTTSTTTISTADPDYSKKVNQTTLNTPDYEEEEEEDEGFSFGSVLKLLLSDSYDATTAPSIKKKTTAAISRPLSTKITTTPSATTTTRRPAPMPSLAPFVPMPNYPYAPPKKTFQQNTVNRIDHLVLGEATAIKKSTSRPTVSPFRPVTSTLRPVTTRRILYTTRTTTRREELTSEHTSASPEEASQHSVSNVSPGVGGLLKLAGCNIYGRMYRVGRIIAELSTPCHECRCTELGVQCRPLPC